MYPSPSAAAVEDPLVFLRANTATATMGNLVSAYDPTLRTRVYFGASAPNSRGNMPLIDPNAKAVVLYFHGSGTEKAGGRNFLSRMPALMNAGIAPVSVDLPFHSEGPVDSQFLNIDYFMEWVRKLVQKCQAAGKPIYMVGHSFGPTVIKEYTARYPKDIAGALLISASGSFHPALRWTYQNITTPGMKYIDENLADSTVNELGGKFGDAIEKATTWVKLPAPDTRFLFFRGTDDEWFPENRWLPARLGVKQMYGPRVVDEWLQRKFPTAQFEFIEGVGHYIFEVKHPSGRNLILERIFDMVGVDEVSRNREARLRTAVEQVIALYYNHPVFRHWAGPRYPHLISSERRAEEALMGWQVERLRLWKAIYSRIPQRYPAFYEARVASWEHLGTEMAKALEKGSEKELLQELQSFTAEFTSYLERSQGGRRPVEICRDPRLPRVSMERLWEIPVEVTRWGVMGAVLQADFEEALEGNGSLIAWESTNSPYVVRARYRLHGKEEEFSSLLFTHASRLALEQFLEGVLVTLYRQNQWNAPSEKWEIEYEGIFLKGNLKGGELLRIEPKEKAPAKTKAA